MFFDNETIVSLPTPYLKLIGAYIYANMNFRIGIGRNISYRPIYWIGQYYFTLRFRSRYIVISCWISIFQNYFIQKEFFFFALLVSTTVLADNKISIIGIYQYQNEKKAN